MISTRDLSAMPDLAGFRRLARSVAMLDAILSPEWEFRYYSFNSKWAEGEMMASMRNGSGDEWHALLSARGIGLIGLAHESPMYRMGNPWPGIFDSVPTAFADVVAEPAFESTNASFCIWRAPADVVWQVGAVQYPPADDPDGSEELLAILDADPRTYQAWAETYDERTVDLAAVEAIYAHQNLSEGLVGSLNPGVTFGSLEDDVLEIGYPDAD